MPYLNASDSPKMLRETLCAAAAALGEQQLGDRRREHIARLGRLIAECDRHRPLGSDGKHGDRHTLTCGCEDTGSDPCAEFPDAVVPQPYRPPPGTRARHGGKEAPNIYLHTADDLKGLCIGRLDKPEYAAFAIEAINSWLEVQRDNDTLRAASRAGINVGAGPYPELYAIMRDCEALLAGRNAGDSELIHQELRRMRGQLDTAIRAVEDAGEGEEDRHA